MANNSSACRLCGKRGSCCVYRSLLPGGSVMSCAQYQPRVRKGKPENTGGK
jgi:hypothetical protein